MRAAVQETAWEREGCGLDSRLEPSTGPPETDREIARTLQHAEEEKM